MKRSTIVVCFLLFLPLLLNSESKATPSGLPPIINRDLFFGDPEIAGAQISPDGNYISFLKPWKDTRNIYVKAVDEPFSAARLLTTETKRPVPAYFWSRDSKYILYVKDKDGDENFNVYAVDPTARPAAGADAPPSRDLTGLKGVRVVLYDLPKKEPDILYMGLNDRDKAWHDLYKLRISTGEKSLVRKNTDRVTQWFFDLDGNLRMATRAAENGDTEFLRVDPDSFTKVYSCNVFESCALMQFQPGNQRIYIQTNKDANLVSLALFDPQTGKAELVESDPMGKVDFSGALFSEATDELVETWYTAARTKTYYKAKAFGDDVHWIEHKFGYPKIEVMVVSRTRDESKWLVAVASDTEPGQTFLFIRKTRTLIPQFKVREKLPREYLAEMKPVSYPSSDGLEVPGYLTLPKGIPPKNLPTLMLPHGGPWGRDGWGYNPLAQFFANRGYAVLMPNFRGSTGYGKKFLDAGNLEWGNKMQDDITWGAKYLIAQGIADPKRIGILGGSYGGYATLAGVTFTPDLYGAGVDIVGPSNLITLLDSFPPYWEQIRKMLYSRMGDPSTPQGKALLVERSPLTHADRIKTPLLIVQGANDPRVNRREAEQIVIALRDRGFPVEYLLAPDEGHGFARPVNNLAMFIAAENFLAKHLGGRAQEGGSPEATKRLAEITVDPKTVVLTKKMDASAIGVPKPAVALTPGTYSYKAKISMGTQEIALTVITIIQEENGAWSAIDKMQTPMGQVTESAVLDKETLVVRRQTTEQGPLNIKLDFTDKKVSGTLSMNGQDKPINADLSGPLFATGPGSMQSIASLPLADGYTTNFRNFDVQSQKEKLMALTVAGSESIKVDAGTFDSYKVEISSADGGNDKQTLWIAKDSRKPVKLEALLPAMGGATMRMELVP